MSATVDGAFRIIDKASGPLRKMEERALKLDAALKGVGDRLDTLDKHLDSTITHVKTLSSELSKLGRQKATPKVDLQGISKAVVQIEALRRAKERLDNNLLDNAKPTGPIARVNERFGMMGRVMGTATAGILGTVTAFGRLVPLLVLALPAVVALTGAVGALASSLTFAVGGAGVLGGGAIALLATGIGSVAAVTKSALMPLKDYRKAVEGLNKAQAEGDPRKIQAAAAAVDALAKKAPGLARFSAELDKTKEAFNGMVGNRGRQAFFGFGSEGLKTLRTLMSDMRTEVNRNAKAFFDSFQPIFKFMRGDEFEGFLHAVSDTWQRSIGPFMKGALDYGRGFLKIIQAGLPYIEQWSRSFRQAGQAFNDRASANATDWVDHMVNSFKQWKTLVHSTVDLLGALFAPSRTQGDSLVTSLSGTFDKWTEWLHDNPSKVRDFFTKAVDDTRRLASALASIVSALWNIGQALQPLIGMFASLSSSGGLLQLAGGYAAGRGIFRAGKRWGGGATGAGGGGAPLVVGGAAGASGVSRLAAARAARAEGGGVGTMASNYRYLRGAEGAGGGILKGVAKGALRKAGPLAAAFGAYDFFTTQGNIGDKTKATLNGFGFGIPGMIAPGLFKSAAEKKQEALERASKAKNVGTQQGAAFALGGAADVGAIDTRVGRIRSRLSAGRDIFARDASVSKDIADAQRDYAASSDPQQKAGIAGYIRAQQVKIHPKLSAEDTARYQAQLKELTKDRKIRVQLTNARSRQHAGQLQGEFQEGFAQLRGAGASPVDAFTRTSNSAIQTISRMRRAGHTEGATRMADLYDNWARSMAQKNPKLEGAVKDLGKRVDTQLDKMGGKAKRVGGGIVEDLSGSWDTLNKRLHTKNEQLLSDFSTTLTKTEQRALKVLKAMGLSDSAGRAVLAGSTVNHAQAVDNSRGGHNAAAGLPGSVARARGGVVPGVGLTDTVGMGGAMVAPGENVVVANRHTTSRINRMLAPFGTDMMSEINGEGRPHAEPMQRFAKGGVANFGGHPANVTPGIKKLIGLMEGKFPGLSVSSTTDHSFLTSNGNQSDHTTGHAVDIAGDPALMNRAASWIMSSGLFRRLKQGIHNPNLSVNAGAEVPSSFWGPTTWGQHLNHLHLALAGGLAGKFKGGGGAAFKAMSPIQLNAMGVPGAAAQGGVNAVTAAMNQRMRKAARQLGVGGGNLDTSGMLGGFNPSAKGGALTATQVAKLAESVGLPGVTFAQIAKGESGYIPTAVGHDPGGTQGLGLWQITTGYNDDIIKRFGGREAMFDPRTNARAAKAIYDRQGIGAWRGTRYMTDPNAHYKGKSKGGPIFGGMFGDGGTLTTDRPTYIGVGERGRSETVTVTPKGKRGAGGGLVVEKLVVYGNEDTKQAVMDAFRDLTQELNLGTGTNG